MWFEFTKLIQKMLEILKYWIVRILKVFIRLLDALTDLLFGYTFTGGSKLERLYARDYEHSAQVVKILWRAKPKITARTRECNFMYKHERYLHPDFILDNKNITLMMIDATSAYFCITDPTVDVCDPKKFPFMCLGQYSMAQKFVILPIRSFHRLASKIGDPKVPVTCVNMTARCGSTLLVQILNRVPKTRILSEPWSTLGIVELRTFGKITPRESDELLKSAMRLQMKVEEGSEVERIFVKLSPYNAPLQHDLMKLFPSFNHVFNTRHPVPSTRSLKHLFMKATSGLYHNLGFLRRGIRSTNYIASFHRRKGRTRWPYLRMLWYGFDEITAMQYCNVLSTYFDYKEKYAAVILYEDLSEDPEKEIGKLFNLMQIDEKYLETSMEALKQDSQSGFFGQRGEARLNDVPKSLLDRVDEYLDLLAIPGIRSNISEVGFKRAMAQTRS